MSSARGFTLLEMLIALALTAVVCTVLFSTWRFTASHSVWIHKSVAQRETSRLLPSILDADMAGLTWLQDENGRPLLPPPGRVPMSRFHLPVTDQKDSKFAFDDAVLLAFPTTTSLSRQNAVALVAPVCVEYVLRPLSGGTALVRRERAFCGVRGDFPWEELVLLRNIRRVELAALLPDQGYIVDWEGGTPLPQAIRLRLFREEDNDIPWLELLTPLPQQRVQVHKWR